MIVKNMIINCIGFIGGSILGLQLIPQIYKAYKTKSTNDISTFFLLMNIVGLTLMTTYGICNNDMPLYLPTSISLMNSFILLKSPLLTFTNYFVTFLINLLRPLLWPFGQIALVK